MRGPSSIELGRLFLGENQFGLTFRIGKALPERHCQFGPVAGGKSQELRERSRFHGVDLLMRLVVSQGD